MNKRKIILLIILDVICALLAIGIIALDLFVVSVPKWMSLVTMFVTIFFVIAMWRIGKRRWGKVVFTILNLLVLFVVFVGTYCNPYRNGMFFYQNKNYECREFTSELTYEEAKADLDEAMRHLENVHPVFLHGLTPQVKELYEQAEKHLQEKENISVNELCREIETIFSSLQDGHTFVRAVYPEEHYLKYIYSHFLAEDELTAVNGQTPEEILERNRNYFSFETDSYGMNYIDSYLETREGLDYLGFRMEDGITFTYRDCAGNLFEETYSDADFLTIEEYWEYNDPENLRQQETESEEPFVSYEILEQDNLALLSLNRCIYNEEYKTCLADMFREIKEKNIENVCVDLRGNGGGNSLVADEFIHYLDVDAYDSWGQDWRLGPFLISSEGMTMKNHKKKENLFAGDVYVLTSTGSFSAAMDFGMLIKDNGLGKIVGEASGNKIRSYGDVAVFQLKNSGLVMQVSMKKWYRVDELNPEEFLEPDIPCDSEAALEVLKEYLKNG